jgi:site-specific DNA recombinase
MPTRCIIYCRVSSDSQEKDGTSLDTQLESCRVRAASKGYQIAAEFRETFTGTKLWERPKLMAAVDMVKAGKADVLLVHALDRLSRDQGHRAWLRIEAAKRGATVESVTEDADDSLPGKVLEFVTGLYAEYELVLKKERTDRGRKGRADKGRLLTSNLPYGYRWADPEAGKKTRMVIQENEAEIVRHIFRTLAGGGTLTNIMYTLNAEGIPIPSPKEGRINKWCTKTLGRMVRNDAYIGKAWAFKEESRIENGKRVRSLRPEAERIALPEGVIPPIIDEATFHKAAERLDRNKREATRNHRKPHLYLLRGGYAKCFHCGGTLEAMVAPRGDRYYRCIPAQRRKHGCPSCTIRAEELEAGVWDWVKLVLEHPAWIEQHAKRQAESDTSADELDTLNRALLQLNQQAENVARIAAMTTDSEAAAPLATQLDAIAGQKRTLQARRQTLIDLMAARDRTKGKLAALSDVWAERYAQIEAMTIDERRDVLADFGVSATVFPKDQSPRFVVDMAFDLRSWFDAETGFLNADAEAVGMPGTVAEWAAVPDPNRPDDPFPFVIVAPDPGIDSCIAGHHGDSGPQSRPPRDSSRR